MRNKYFIFNAYGRNIIYRFPIPIINGPHQLGEVYSRTYPNVWRSAIGLSDKSNWTQISRDEARKIYPLAFKKF